MNTTALADDPVRTCLMETTTVVMNEIEQLRAERDQLRQRVTQLEAECTRLGRERGILLNAWIDTQITPEEIERIRKEPGGRTWPEIRERLERMKETRLEPQ